MNDGSLFHRPLRDGLAPGLAVVGNPDLEVLDAAVRAVLAGNVEQSLDAARAAQINDQLVRISGRRTDKLGVPDRAEVAVAGPGRLVIRRVAIGGELLDSGLRQSPTSTLRESSRGWPGKRDARWFPTGARRRATGPWGSQASAPPWPCGLRGLRKIRLASGSPRLTTLSAEL